MVPLKCLNDGLQSSLGSQRQMAPRKKRRAHETPPPRGCAIWSQEKQQMFKSQQWLKEAGLRCGTNRRSRHGGGRREASGYRRPSQKRPRSTSGPRRATETNTAEPWEEVWETWQTLSAPKKKWSKILEPRQIAEDIDWTQLSMSRRRRRSLQLTRKSSGARLEGWVQMRSRL